VTKIWLSPPHMGDEERDLLAAAFDSNWISTCGPDLDSFERELGGLLGGTHVAALQSGTAALLLALILLDAGAGDEIWTSTLTFVATANAICYVGAKPVFVDVDRGTWNLDPDILEEGLAAAAKRGNLPKAVVAVDLFGQCADFDRLRAACEPYEIPLIEDAAGALGATYRGRPAGTLAELGVLSFNGNKVLTTGGGGALVSRRRPWIERARLLANQAHEPACCYHFTEQGYSYRLSNLLAAVGRGQLRVLEERVASRRANKKFYRRALGDLPGLQFMPDAAYGKPSNWLTCLTLNPDESSVTPLMACRHFEAADIEARQVWEPMHTQPVFAASRCLGGDVARRLHETGICLPSGSALGNAERERVVRTFRSLFVP